MYRLQKYIAWRWKISKISFMSLFYNSHLNSDYVFDTLIQPAFWFVDHFTAVLGPIFVFLVIFLTVSQRFKYISCPVMMIFLVVNCGVHCLLDWSSILSTIQEPILSMV